jgi:hypothetical protein
MEVLEILEDVEVVAVEEIMLLVALLHKRRVG